MNEFTKQFEQFTNEVSWGVEITAHSGPNGQPAATVTSVREYYEADEIACEQHWHNYLDSEGLELLITIEDILNGEGTSDLLEVQVLGSFTNGQFKQFREQFDNLDDKEEFIDWLIDAGAPDQVKILRAIALHEIG